MAVGGPIGRKSPEWSVMFDAASLECQLSHTTQSPPCMVYIFADRRSVLGLGYSPCEHRRLHAASPLHLGMTLCVCIPLLIPLHHRGVARFSHALPRTPAGVARSHHPELPPPHPRSSSKSALGRFSREQICLSHLYITYHHTRPLFFSTTRASSQARTATEHRGRRRAEPRVQIIHHSTIVFLGDWPLDAAAEAKRFCAFLAPSRMSRKPRTHSSASSGVDAIRSIVRSAISTTNACQVERRDAGRSADETRGAAGDRWCESERANVRGGA